MGQATADSGQIAERSETRGCRSGCSTTNKRSVAIDRSFNSSSDIVLNGLSLAARLDYANSIDIPTFDAVMNEVMTLPVFTVVHIAKSTRPLVADVLSGELCLCVNHSMLGMGHETVCFCKICSWCASWGWEDETSCYQKSISVTY